MQLPTIPKASDTQKQKRIPVYRKIAKWMWGLAIAGFFAVVFFFIYLSYQDLPTFEELENPKNHLASEVFTANAEVLGRYYYENRIPVDYEELSPHLINALIATEDERYFKHSGIDGVALGRVLVRTLVLQNRSAGGGSTITQQLAKLLYSSRNFSGMSKAEMVFSLVTRKFKEWITAVKLEKSYTKEEIIAMYLNQFDFINGAYGVRAASEIYFGKPQDSLQVEEAAMLIGMLKNPSLYNPLRRPDITKHRRMIVLNQMMKNNLLSQVQYDSLLQLPLGIRFQRQTHIDGVAPYFRAELVKELKRILAEEAQKKPDGSEYNIYSDGLKIQTTIDLDMQKKLEEAVLAKMPELQEKFWSRWKNKDPWTYRTPETTNRELEIRQRSLESLIRNSERYQNLRNKHLEGLIEAFIEKVDYKLRDYDIERMLEEEESKGYIKRLTSNKIIPRTRAITYQKIMSSPQWDTLKTGWKKFQKAVDDAFSTPVPMKVFAYNENFEKDTIMSPLDSLRYHRMFLQTGSIAIEPLTGYVKAWVGGINYKYFKYDHVTTPRQVGSTFKPFIYATAIAMQGISPCYEVVDQPYTIHVGESGFNLIENWTPDNSSGAYSYESFTLKEALKKSKNTVSVYLMKQLGDTEEVRKLARNLGLDPDQKYSNGAYKIPKQPSICLGSADLTAFEMTGAYAAFANNGYYNKPIIVSMIKDRNGKVIYQSREEGKQAINEKANYVMVEMLRHVSRWTRDTKDLKSDIGGKTGTTNDYTDGWFMGITPDLVVGTWVGGEDRWIRFRSLDYGQGARMARPIFGDFIKRLETDSTSNYNLSKQFHIPSGEIGIILDCNEYKSIYNIPEIDKEEDESFGDDIFGDEVDDLLPKGEEEFDEDF